MMLKVGDLVAVRHGIDQVVPSGERGLVRAVGCWGIGREVLVWFCAEYKPYSENWFLEQDLILLESIEKRLERVPRGGATSPE